MKSLRITRRISELSPEEARALASALYGRKPWPEKPDAVALAELLGLKHYVVDKITGSNQHIALRARPGPFGYRTEVLLYGRKPWPEKPDAVALAELLGLKHYVVDNLRIALLIKEASYAGVKPSELAAATA